MIITRQGFIYIPKPARNVKGSVTVGGIEVKSKMLDLEVMGKDSSIGTAMAILANKDGAYNDSFSHNDVMKVFLDYTDGTTQIFEGEVYDLPFLESPYPKIQIKARDYADQARQEIVNKSYSTLTYISTIFKELIADKLPTHTTTNVISIPILVTPSWTDTSLVKCLQELMILANGIYGFYCDVNKDWHTYIKSTNYNYREALVYGRSLKRPFRFGKTLDNTYNVITLYGKDLKGMPLIYTDSDADSITDYGRRVMPPTKNNNITTISELEERVKSMLDILKTPELIGEGNAKGMDTIRPGQVIPVYAMRHGTDGDYVIKEYTHQIKNNKFITKFKVHERSQTLKSIADILKEQSDTTKEITDITNPFDMRYSYPYTFDDESYINTTRSTTYEVVNGNLKPKTSSARVYTNVFVADSNLAYAHLKVKGEDLNNVEFDISVDGGATFKAITPDTKLTITDIGRGVVIRITLKYANARIESVCVLYSV